MIRMAVEADLSGIDSIFNEIFDYERLHGAFTVWKKGVYPTSDTAKSALLNSSLFVSENGKELNACIIIDHIAPAEYSDVDWHTEASGFGALILHLLCVRPSKHGQGIGTEMVNFAIDEARRRGCAAVRLNTGNQNTPALSLYTKLGFEMVDSKPMLIGGTIPHSNQLFLEYTLAQ